MGQILSRRKKNDIETEVELPHFKLLRSIGKGAFGKVRVVEKRSSRRLYALKYINKAKCIRQKAVNNTLRERFILQEIEYPFVVNLRYAFQDDENMFVILDLMRGGSLRYHLDRTRTLSEKATKWMAAELALACAYLHERRIVHRDIKPDNILLDDNGHMHLTDFNIAARVEHGKYLTSQSGTLSYMAPEMFEKKGYGTAIDFWSIGVIMYECIYGHIPFRADSEELCIKDIREVVIPYKSKGAHKEPVSSEFISAVQGFLSRDKYKRLGCTSAGLTDVKQHPFFADVPWDRLESKELQAPFVPDAKMMHFDPTHELEELLLEEHPLTIKTRKRKPKRNLANFRRSPDGSPVRAQSAAPSIKDNASTLTAEENKSKKKQKPEIPLSAEMQLIEDAFLPFDFEARAIYLEIADEVMRESSATFPGVIQQEMQLMVARERERVLLIETSRLAQSSQYAAESTASGIIPKSHSASLPIPIPSNASIPTSHAPSALDAASTPHNTSAEQVSAPMNVSNKILAPRPIDEAASEVDSSRGPRTYRDVAQGK